MAKVPLTAYTKGSPSVPEISTENIRLYSSRFCPYAHRVRLVLGFKNIPYETININLREKPEWYASKNPLGKVPLLEEKGTPERLFESLVIAEYLDDKFHDHPLLPADDPLGRAKQKMLTELIHDKIEKQWHPLMMKEDEEKKKVLIQALEYVETLLDGPYFAGESVGFVDLMVWPWFERLPAVELFRGVPFTDQLYPKLTEWTKKMRGHARLKEAIHPTDLHHRFLQTRNFNEGL